MLRCAVPDRPGALAALAGAIGEVGGDIQAVDVVETGGEVALDDLVVVLHDDTPLSALLDSVRSVDGVELIHAGPSRGHPGDAVSRLMLGIESMLNGAMDVSHGVQALIGGLLRAVSVELVDPAKAPRRDAKTLVLPFGALAIVAIRDYRFTDTERTRAEEILRTGLEVARHLR